ncbi:hypothetical protein EPO15_05125 [bacterium]|nr:MAG: hypothetical protein EPO15_05125 [bacterium]
MKTLTRVLATALSVTLASQNALAQFSRAVVRPVPVAPTVPIGAAAGLRVNAAPLTSPTLALPAGLAAPLALPAPKALPLPLAGEGGVRAAAVAVPVASALVSPAVVSPAATPHPNPLPQAGEGREKAAVSERVAVLGKTVSEGMKGVAEMPQSGARDAASAQFSLLTGERFARTAPASDAAPVAGSLGTLGAPRLAPANRAAEGDAKAEVPPPAKRGWAKVFNDPERNKAFWRYFIGSSVFSFGFQMYMVALPYLIKSFTQNTLKEAGKLDQLTKEQLTEMVRQNRSMSRIAHWVAQAVSYVAIPMFNDGQSAPKKWLVRALLARAAALAGVPALFFATGLMTGGAAMWTLFGLIAVQSFFQGLSITMESGGTARLFGDKSVTTEERLRANSIMSFTGAIIAIIAPVVAGRIAAFPDWMGKMGTGSAVLYGIYAAAVGATALIYATIKMFGEKKAEAAAGADAAEGASPAPKGFGAALKNVLVSMKEGVKLVMKNRFLRTLVGLNLIASLFSDPLIFNVLPEFVEGVLKANPAAMSWALGIPGVGWFLQGLISTPMGFFGMLVAASSIGSAIVALTVEPMRRLFKRLGFKTEESLTIPFYIIAAIEVPAFWAMAYFPSFWGVLALYGLQSLVGGYVGLIVSGVYQKQLGGYSSKQLTQVLAANSFVSILAAIASTYLYGFLLPGISIQTSLLIAAIATTILGTLRLAAPWLFFTKAERKGEPEPAPKALKPLDVHRDGSHGTDNLPGKQGPLSIGL